MPKKLSLIFFSLFFFVMGIVHFVDGPELAKITPLPYPLEIVWITGIMELIFAIFLFIPKYRRNTGILLGVYLVAVLPANINMAINSISISGEPVEPWLLWVRVALQFPLIVWILWATGFFEKGRVNHA